MNTKRSSRLIQTVVKPTVMRQLDSLARATGHTRASYLRHLVELHVTRAARMPKNREVPWPSSTGAYTLAVTKATRMPENREGRNGIIPIPNTTDNKGSIDAQKPRVHPR